MTEAELLFTEALNCDRASLYLRKDLFLDKDAALFIAAALKKRAQGQPLQYIIGKTEFMGVEFKVGPDVFIPRPETEILVEKAINIAERTKDERRRTKDESLSILDIGTGSGCIAISLAKFISNIRITATDISSSALNVAKHNAKLNNVYDKIEFIKSDLFSASSFVHLPSSFDLIASNPPYIPRDEIDKMQPEINYEPRIALDGGGDGLDFYRRIISESPHYLKNGGLLILEMGFNQRKRIENIFHKSGKFEIIDIVKDYNNIDRVIIARNIA